MAARLSGWRALAVPPLVTASAILATLAGAAIGTPEIAATIAVPWSVSTLYAIVYTATLIRERRPQSPLKGTP